MGRHNREDWVIIENLIDVILNNVEGCVVEIGVGVSTIVLFEHTSKMGVKQFSCDINKKKCNWAKEFIGLEIFEGKSLDFIKQFPNIPVAFVLLDGDHTYSVVIKELNFFLSKLSPGGVIFIHDTLPRSAKNVNEKYTVYKVRQEIEQRSDLRIFTWPYTAWNSGLTMIMQKEKNPPYYRK